MARTPAILVSLYALGFSVYFRRLAKSAIRKTAFFEATAQYTSITVAFNAAFTGIFAPCTSPLGDMRAALGAGA